MKHLARTVTGLAAVLLLSIAIGAAPGTHAGGWKMLPGDVIAAAHFDVVSLVESELYQALVEQYGDPLESPGAKYLEFVEATGFKIQEDLETLTFGAGQPDGNGDGAFYMIVSGDFDREKFDAYVANRDDVRHGKLGKLETYMPTNPGYDGPPPTVAWIDERTLIMATTPDFPRLVASARGSGLTEKGSALGGLLAGAEGEFYLAMQIPETSATADSQDGSGRGIRSVLSQLQNPAAGPMQNLETILITLDASSGVELIVQGSTDTPENGQLVYDMLNGYLMMGRSMAAQDPQTSGIFDNLALARKGSTVEIGIAMSGDEVIAALTRSPAGP